MPRSQLKTHNSQLIINADDLGLSAGVTRGILELARSGAVTSTSLLMTLPGSRDALEAARAIGLDVGLHLNLSVGAPLSPPHAIPSLLMRASASRSRLRPVRRVVGPRSPALPSLAVAAVAAGEGESRFATATEIMRRLCMGQVRLEEVEREWSAQIELFLASGVRPSHLDSHCHLHGHPSLYRLIVRLARRHGIPGVRNAHAGFILQARGLHGLRLVLARSRGRNRAPTPYHPDYFSVLSVMGRVRTARPLEALLQALPPGVTELVCHPGHVDDELRRIDPLTDGREREWLLLSRPLVHDLLVRRGIRLMSWADATQ